MATYGGGEEGVRPLRFIGSYVDTVPPAASLETPTVITRTETFFGIGSETPSDVLYSTETDVRDDRD